MRTNKQTNKLKFFRTLASRLGSPLPGGNNGMSFSEFTAIMIRKDQKRALNREIVVNSSEVLKKSFLFYGYSPAYLRLF